MNGDRPPAATSRQLVLDLARPSDLSREALVEADCNSLAVAWIDRWPDWPAPALLIHGPRSSGKSHLLGLWARVNGARIIPVESLGSGQRPRDIRYAAIDDVDKIAGNRAEEEAVFHLYNDCQRSGGSLLLTAQSPVSRWPIGLPDLATRLRTAPQIAIEAPDDEALVSVLKKQLADYQLVVPDDELRFAICHIERSFEAAARFAVFLNRVSLRDRRKITRRFVSSVIKEFIAH